MADEPAAAQPDLFNAEPWNRDADLAPFQKHSATSRSAADAIEPNAGTLRAKVLAVIRGCGERGATDLEVQRAISLGGSTQRPRRVKLVELGLVQDSGRTRLTESGRKAVVWMAVGPDHD